MAQRNSERARSERPASRTLPVAIETAQGPVTQAPQASASFEDNERDVQSFYTWLNERGLTTIPEPLKRDLEVRAVDRFFINWIIHPSRDGLSPGHMHDLPKLYYSCPSGSILWLAVRAVAFADTKNARHNDVTFDIKARSSYGSVLARIRESAVNDHELASDHMLVSLLLVDTFEVVAPSYPPKLDALR